ncbi:hypothetical protein G4B88_023690 [Cannabis sativa]|uniref:RRM domain-containing protein n=1 Tax=Cannabis sativa TaxID=3483 RepID=A0A7J6HV65_CANSA|nr:hypothetical protein G4B88_023690 [Cannabis sativa]
MESTHFNKKKIFIGGLPHQIEEAELKTYFSDFGTVVATEILREKITNKGRGFGFVTFDSEEAVEKVLENNFYNLKEKQIEVKMAKEKINRRNQIPTATNNLNQSQPPLGLPHQIEEAELKTYFSNFGTVVATEILREKITNKGRGFGQQLT